MDEQDIWQSMMPVEKERPKGLLYHYTTSDGLLGIIQRSHIWATHIRYFNDQSEFQNAFDRQYSDAFVSSFVPGADESLKVGIRDIMISVRSKWENFLTAFTDDESAHIEDSSAAGDRLSQWRSYSRGSGGYSLGFDHDGLLGSWDGCALRRANGALWIQRCIYRAAQKIEEAKSIGSEGLKRLLSMKENLTSEFLREHKRNPDEQECATIQEKCISKGAAATSAAYPIHAARFKHEAFWEECEWRFVFHVLHDGLIEANRTSPDRPILNFRAGLFGVTPYIEYPLSLATDKNPLRRIVVGPCPHPDEAVKAVEMLLAANGIRGVEVAKSNIPYRNW
jgi:hypothetical protein